MRHAAFLTLAGVLTLFVMLFPLLGADAIANLISKRAMLEPGNVALIFYLEASRAIGTTAALIAAVVLLVRSSRRTDGQTLILFILFLAITVEKVFGAAGFPGPFQERLTLWLLAHGVSRPVLAWIFGPVPWSAWLAWAALIRFSVTFPQPALSVAMIDASAAYDRKGMMRGARVAGADIGVVLRALSRKLLAAGAFGSVPVWASAFAMVVLTTLLDRTGRLVLLGIAGTLVTAVAITNLRAGYATAPPETKPNIRSAGFGFLAAAAVVVLAAVPLLFMDDPRATVPALVLLMLAPAVMMLSLLAAVSRAARHLV